MQTLSLLLLSSLLLVSVFAGSLSVHGLISEIGIAEQVLETQRIRLESLAEQKKNMLKLGHADYEQVKESVAEMIEKAEKTAMEVWAEAMATIESIGSRLKQVSEMGRDLGLGHAQHVDPNTPHMNPYETPHYPPHPDYPWYPVRK